MYLVTKSLKYNKEKITNNLISVIQSIIAMDTTGTDVEKLKEQIKTIEGKRANLIDLYMSNLISKDEFTAARSNCDKEIAELQSVIDSIDKQHQMIEQQQQLIKEIGDAINEIVGGVEYEDDFYKHILDKMVVIDKDNIDVYLNLLPIKWSYTVAKASKKAVASERNISEASLPTDEPTTNPTATPTTEPTAEPTATPTAEPTEEPTATPTAEPTEEPTATPTVAPMPIVIIQQPKNQSAMVGQRAVFSVQASGEKLTYQWYVNRNDGLGFMVLEGATSAAHTTTALTQDNDDYQYYCLVSNGETSIQSDVVTLSVVADVDVPKTGDSTKLALWLTMAATSSVGLIFILSQTRRRKG